MRVCLVVEDEMDDDVMDDKEEPSEESRPVRGGQSRVMMPTLKERQEHERTHLPDRSWCRHCVAARASNPAHRGGTFPIAIEEATASCETNQEWNQQRFLVSKDRATRMVSAHVVLWREQFLI